VAVEEAAYITHSNIVGSPEQVSRASTLPLVILSTSFPGVALVEYREKGDEARSLERWRVGGVQKNTITGLA